MEACLRSAIASVPNRVRAVSTMTDYSDLPLFGTVTVIAIGMAVSPGQDFALVSRNAILHSRRAGVWTSIGISAAVWLHVAYCITGVALLVTQLPTLYSAIRWVGAGYLAYLGVKGLLVSKLGSTMTTGRMKAVSDRSAFGAGFLCNALNPKTTLFFLSIFTQVIKPSTALGIQAACGLIVSLAHLVWFSAVAFWFSTPALLDRVWQLKPWIERAMGAILLALAMHLALA